MPKKSTVAKEVCQRHGCNKEASSKCKYCKDSFCSEHKEPRLTATRQYIESITNPRVRQAYWDDWQKEDGHPDPRYTVIRKRELEQVYSGPSRPPIWQGGRREPPVSHPPYPSSGTESEAPVTPSRSSQYTSAEKRRPKIALVGIAIVIITVLIGVYWVLGQNGAGVAGGPTASSLNNTVYGEFGAPTNQYNSTYYSIGPANGCCSGALTNAQLEYIFGPGEYNTSTVDPNPLLANQISSLNLTTAILVTYTNSTGSMAELLLNSTENNSLNFFGQLWNKIQANHVNELVGYTNISGGYLLRPEGGTLPPIFDHYGGVDTGFGRKSNYLLMFSCTGSPDFQYRCWHYAIYSLLGNLPNGI